MKGSGGREAKRSLGEADPPVGQRKISDFSHFPVLPASCLLPSADQPSARASPHEHGSVLPRAGLPASASPAPQSRALQLGLQPGTSEAPGGPACPPTPTLGALETALALDRHWAPVRQGLRVAPPTPECPFLGPGHPIPREGAHGPTSPPLLLPAHGGCSPGPGGYHSKSPIPRVGSHSKSQSAAGRTGRVMRTG